MAQLSKMATNRWFNYQRSEQIGMGMILEFCVFGFIIVPILILTLVIGIFIELISG